MTQAVMTAQEFAAARATLGLSVDAMAADLGVTPHSVEAMESGTVRVPARISKDVAYRAAERARELVLEQSGLPECPVAAAIERAAEQADAEKTLALIQKMTGHAASCPQCKARADYLARHGPPLPELPMPGWIRGIGWLDRQINRIPRFLRPPEGAAGEGRRVGVIAAAAFSLLALGIAAFGAIMIAMGHASDPGWWKDPLSIALFVPIAYFIGFFLAGWGFDATRGIRHRFIGYVIRGAIGAGSVYGTMGLMMPVIERGGNLHDWPILVGFFTILGAIGGGVLWVVHRVKGKLPDPAA